jgi:DNA end-binding protein Ku
MSDMPRSIWKGAISFGLVNVPVTLYAAERTQELRFNQLDRRTMSRVREKRVDEKSGQEVPYEEIVKGFDTGGGQYVVLTEDDLKRANPKATQTVNIIGFVNADEIDLSYFVKPFYLAPIGSGKKGYALLRAVLRESGRVAIAKVVIRTREHLCAVIARNDVLVLETLRYAYELRDTSELDLPGDDLTELGLTQPEITMAEQLIEAMVTPWDPAAYKDDYRDDLLRVIAEKERIGHVEAVATGQPSDSGEGQVIDIMALLKRSVDEVREAGGENAAAGGSSRAGGKSRTGGTPSGGGARARGAKAQATGKAQAPAKAQAAEEDNAAEEDKAAPKRGGRGGRRRAA